MWWWESKIQVISFFRHYRASFAPFRAPLCVCVRERERESVCVCLSVRARVHVCVGVRVCDGEHECAWEQGARDRL